MCAALCAAGLAAAQGDLVIRTESRLVLVDAVVRDKAGRIVRDLEAKDFRVWEDGKEQTVTGFHREAPGSQEPKAQPEYVVFQFGAGLPPHDVEQVNDFVSAFAGRDRYVAAVAYPARMKVVQNFTDSAERFERALEAYRPEVGVAPPPGNTIYAQSGANRGYAGGLSISALPAGPTWPLSALKDLAEGVAGIRGRKIVVLLGLGSGGEATGIDAEFVAAACNRANLGVYTSETSLREVAERTGGRLIDGRKLSLELDEIAGEQDEHYVLGYAPRDWAEGSCHSLRVRVGRQDVQVRARQGYCAVKGPDEIAAKVTGRALEQRAGAAAGGVTASARLPYFYAAPNVALVDMAMETAPLDLRFEKSGSKRHAQLDVVGQALTASGAVAGRFSETVKFDFASDQEAEAFRKQPYHYGHQFRLGAGSYNVRIVFGVGERVIGKVETPLTIEPWDGRQLALSGAAISRLTRAATDLSSDLDPSLLEGQKQLVAQSHELLPSGDNRCRRTEPCYAYLEIYDASLGRANATAPRATIRILEKASGREVNSGDFNLREFVHAGNPVVPVIFQPPAGELQPGAYTVEFRVDSGAQSAVRTVDFEVE